MEKLAVIAEVLELAPIPGADLIERASVLGWSVVVRKGLWTVGQRCIMIFHDSYIPRQWVDDSYTEGDEKVRLKTVKMRGQYSAGLLLPLSFLPEGKEYELGEEVSVLLGIEKYVPVAGETGGGFSLGEFPTAYVSKTDEDDFRGVPEALIEARLQPEFHDVEFITTLKVDGMSGTFIRKVPIPGEPADFIVCGRKHIWQEDDTNIIWRLARKYDIKQKLEDAGLELAIQFEACGPGIQSNKMKLDSLDLRVFLMKDLKSMKWVPYDDMVRLCASLGLPVVPEVAERFTQANFPMNSMLQDIANNTKYDSGRANAEGIVIRTAVPVPSKVLSKSWWSIKVLNQPYDMKK